VSATKLEGRRWDRDIFLDWSLVRWDSFVCVVSALIRFGGEPVEYGGWFVLFRMGHRRGGVGVAETVVGLRGWDFGRVTGVTSRFFLVGLVPKYVALAAWSWQRLFSQGSLSATDFSSTYFLGRHSRFFFWHKQVPLKVFVFAWRLLRDRLPTKTNLANRGIIPLEAQSCVSGCGDMESAQHLFISRNIFGSLWSPVRSWIGMSSVDPQNFPDHFLQFTFSYGGPRARRSFLQLFGSCVSGLFGTNEFNDYWEIHNSP
jgi:hypothetical protein